MADENNLTGGFAAVNTGSIKDSYCIFVKKKRNAPSSFVSKNRGDIKTSFSDARDGSFEHYDGKGILRASRIKNESDAASFGYDLDNIWLYDETDDSLSFREENWKKTPGYAGDKRKFSIESASELLGFIDLVNKGDSRVVNAFVRLECDIGKR